MRSKEDIRMLLRQLQIEAQDGVVVDEAAVVADYQKSGSSSSSPAIKVLSILGGIGASLAFLGFLFIAGLYQSAAGMIITGVLCVTGAIWLDKAADKTILDTISVSAFAIGFALVGFGLSGYYTSDDTISLIFILMAGVALIIVRSYVIALVSVLIMAGSIASLAMVNDAYLFFTLYIAVLALITTYVFLQEARLIRMGKAVSGLYNPIRTGLVFALLVLLFVTASARWYLLPNDYVWIPSVVIIGLVLYTIFLLFKTLGVESLKTKVVVYLISAAILLCTLFYPPISGALLVVLLSFMVNYKTGLVAGAAAFIYFVSEYYYNLHFTLLLKSGILFLSGVLFIILYLFTHKKLSNGEAI